MIYIFSAFYAEAKNIIDHYGLKKEKSPEMVRFDVFANESIRLVRRQRFQISVVRMGFHRMMRF
jgi:hypothetical protein